MLEVRADVILESDTVGILQLAGLVKSSPGCRMNMDVVLHFAARLEIQVGIAGIGYSLVKVEEMGAEATLVESVRGREADSWRRVAEGRARSCPSGRERPLARCAAQISRQLDGVSPCEKLACCIAANFLDMRDEFL